MKKIIILLFVTICMMLMSSGAFADISSNLVGYYPFVGDAQDYSGNYNTGTVYGAALTTDKNGANNAAYSFDGVDDYINVSHDSSLDMGDSDFSISYWVFITAGSTGGIILDKRASNGYGYVTSISGLKPFLKIQGLTYSNAYGKLSCSSSMYMTPGYWHHVVVTVDRDDPSGIKFCVDMVLDSTTYNPTAFANIDSGGDLILGRNSLSNSTLLNGKLDEVRIYKRVLSASEVSVLNAITNPDPVEYIASEGINDLAIDSGTDPEVALLYRNNTGVNVKIADTVTGNVIKTVSGFFSGSTDWFPVAITSVNVSGGQAIVVSARNESIDEMKSQTYNLVTDAFESNVVTLPLYGN